MGIYIDDMEMPKRCEECTVAYHDDYGYYCCPFTHAMGKSHHRPNDCPLMEASYNNVENVAYHYKDRIAGYEIRDLVLVTETLRKHNIKPQDLRLRGDAYMKGWEDCERYHDAIMRQVVLNIEGHINAFDERGEKP